MRMDLRSSHSAPEDLSAISGEPIRRKRLTVQHCRQRGSAHGRYMWGWGAPDAVRVRFLAACSRRPPPEVFKKHTPFLGLGSCHQIYMSHSTRPRKRATVRTSGKSTRRKRSEEPCMPSPIIAQLPSIAVRILLELDRISDKFLLLVLTFSESSVNVTFDDGRRDVPRDGERHVA